MVSANAVLKPFSWKCTNLEEWTQQIWGKSLPGPAQRFNLKHKISLSIHSDVKCCWTEVIIWRKLSSCSADCKTWLWIPPSSRNTLRKVFFLGSILPTYITLRTWKTAILSLTSETPQSLFWFRLRRPQQAVNHTVIERKSPTLLLVLRQEARHYKVGPRGQSQNWKFGFFLDFEPFAKQSNSSI